MDWDWDVSTESLSVMVEICEQFVAEGGKQMAIRAENIPAEPVNPIIIQACAWCEKDEMHVPLQDCMECGHNRQDDEAVWCSWAPAEKPCEGCGIPAGLCEPETCQVMQAIKKAAM